jgi:hypothetical protein
METDAFPGAFLVYNQSKSGIGYSRGKKIHPELNGFIDKWGYFG